MCEWRSDESSHGSFHSVRGILGDESEENRNDGLEENSLFLRLQESINGIVDMADYEHKNRSSGENEAKMREKLQ